MNTYSIDQISKTGNLDSSLILRQYELDLMAKFTEIKSNDPKLTQKRIAKQIGFSDSTLSWFREDIKMQSPNKATNFCKNVTDRQNTPNCVTDHQNVTIRQTTSNYVTDHHKVTSKSKGGAFDEEDNFITIARNVVDNI